MAKMGQSEDVSNDTTDFYIDTLDPFFLVALSIGLWKKGPGSRSLVFFTPVMVKSHDCISHQHPSISTVHQHSSQGGALKIAKLTNLAKQGLWRGYNYSIHGLYQPTDIAF